MLQRRAWRVELHGDRWSTRVLIALLTVIAGLIVGAVITALSPLVVAAALLGVLAVVAVLVNSQLGLFAFVAVAWLLPFGVVPVSLGSVKLTFVDVTLTLVLLVWLIRVLTHRDERPRLTRLGYFVLAFLALVVVAYVAGSGYGVSAENSRLFLKLLNSIVLFFTIVNCVRTRQQLSQMMAAVILAGAGAAAIGLALYFAPGELTKNLLSSLRPFGYPTTDLLRYIADTETLRATGTSVDPNVLGAVLMLAAVLGISELFSARPALNRGLLIPALSVILLCQLLTFSRSSWVGLVAAVVFLALVRFRKWWVLLGLVVIGLALWQLPSDTAFISHLESGLAGQDRATQMRLGEYKDALTLISRYPFFGVGFGGAPNVDIYVGVSSIYLLMAEQMGLVGVAMFLATMAYALVTGTRRALSGISGALGTSARAARLVAQSHLAGFLAALVAALAAGILDHFFFNLRFPHTVALLWLVVGLGAVSLRLAEGGEV